jgi:hypothetical protein
MVWAEGLGEEIEAMFEGLSVFEYQDEDGEGLVKRHIIVGFQLAERDLTWVRRRVEARSAEQKRIAQKQAVLAHYHRNKEAWQRRKAEREASEEAKQAKAERQRAYRATPEGRAKKLESNFRYKERLKAKKANNE